MAMLPSGTRNSGANSPPESARIPMDRFKQADETGEQVCMFPPIADTVDGVIEKLLPVVRSERGIITHIMLEFRPPGMKTEDVERSMTLFAQEVMPVLKAEAKY